MSCIRLTQLVLVIIALSVGAAFAAGTSSSSDRAAQAEKLSLGHDFEPASPFSGGINLFSSPIDPSAGNAGAMMNGFARIPANPPPAPPTTTTTSQFSDLKAEDFGNPGHGLTLFFKPSSGWDTNPQTRHRDKGSFFVDMDFGAGIDLLHAADDEPTRRHGWDKRLDYEQKLVLSYEGEGLFYERELSGADKVKNTADISYYRRFPDNQTFVNVDVKDQFVNLDGIPFANFAEGAPSLRRLLRPWLAAELNYDYQLQTFRTPPVSAERNSNAQRNAVGSTFYLYTNGKKPYAPYVPPDHYATPFPADAFSSMSLSYAHIWNDARGSDNSFEGDKVSFQLLGLQVTRGHADYHWVPKEVNLRVNLGYSYEWDYYRHPSSQLKGGLKRRDHNDAINILITNTFCDDPKMGSIAGFVQYNLNADTSNLLARDYQEARVTIGVLLQR